MTFIPLLRSCGRSKCGGCRWSITTCALEGILTLDDIVLFAGEKATDELTYADVVDAMKSIYEHPRLATSVLCANDAILSTASLTLGV